jgi:hypothetical protein
MSEERATHNKRINLTVWASRPLLVLRQSLLRTVARKGRATQPAGYAQRYLHAIHS